MKRYKNNTLDNYYLGYFSTQTSLLEKNINKKAE